MILPIDVQEKINQIILKNKPTNLKNVQKSLTEKYKTKSGQGKSLIDNEQDSLLYAVSRMPATYSVILSLLLNLKKQGFLSDINSCFDVGSGTGAGYFAMKEFNENIDISLFERDKNMIKIFDEFQTGQKVQKFDLIKDEFDQKSDLIMTSYVLSELSCESRKIALKKLLNATNKYLLIIDTGTPKVWQEMMAIKEEILKLNAHILAPCQIEKCMLQNDYCQFFARVERTSMHKMVKDATLPYEDEKYFYLLISKEKIQKPSGKRVIRRPVISQGKIGLVLCTEEGILKKEFFKKNKDEFKVVKKAKINDLI